MSTRRLTATTAIALCLFFTHEQTGFADSDALMPTVHRQLFVKHCFECHDAATEEGSVNLEDLTFDIAKDIETAEKWAKILGVINSGEMPPEDSEPLPDDDKAAFLQDLSNRMVTARMILSDTGGEITMRRLNRREYANTIESLLGVRPDVSDLPDDQATAGFDTAGASLFFSSDQLEQYLAAARRSLRLAMNDQSGKKIRTVRVEPEDEYNERYAAAAEQMRDSSQRAKAFLAQTERPASEYGMLDAYSAKKKQHAEWLPLMENYLARPETKTGATLIMTIKQGGYTRIKFPILREHDDGEYIIRVRAAAYPDAEDRLHYLEFTGGQGIGGQGNGRELLGWRKVTGTLEQPQIIEFPIKHGRGNQQQIQIHQRSHQDRADKNLATIDMRNNGVGTPPGLWIDWAEIEGPNTIGREATTIQRAKSLDDFRYEDVQESLRRFAIEAFRGANPDEGYLQQLVGHYQNGLDQGLSPSEAIIDPLAIVLASPSFLYLVEPKAEGSSKRALLSGRELASRLSYFLWSGPPDDELMKLARDGRLSDAGVLREQTARLLADPRADRFVQNFILQWLEIERIDMFQFNGAQFRKFDNAVRASARKEIYQTVHHLIDKRLPLGRLLKSDFVVVNDLMADFYDIDGVAGHDFRAVKVEEDSVRGGLLGTAAFSAMGSDGVRSSPVERGAWVLRHLLNDPPPPAPPNVPQLGRLAGQHLSARELAKAHQEQPQCNQCHQKIDPIGFGLENFDASGQWRDEEVIGIGKFRSGQWTQEKRFAIDPEGTLPDGQKFADFFSLRDSVARHEDAFARGFTEALIAYGLGRPYGFTDEPLAESILQQAKTHQYPIDDFIHALVQSQPFQLK